MHNIKMYINNILSEGLNKKNYNRILKDINIGVEIEVLNDDYSGGDPLETYDHWEVESKFGDFNRELDYFNSRIDRLYYYLPEDIKKFINFESVEKPLMDFNTELGDVYVKVIWELNQVKERASNLITDIKNLREEFLEEQSSEFWLSHIEKLTEEVKQLSLYPEKINDYKEELYTKINLILEELEQSYVDLENFSIEIEEGMDEWTALMSDEISVYTKGSYEDLENLAIRTVKNLLQNMSGTEGAIHDWNIVEDSSLGNDGIEIITSAVSYDNFIKYVPAIITKLRNVGFYGDTRCGYHIGLSSNKIDIHKLIHANYEKYQRMGFNKLTSLMAATQQGYKSVYRYNESSRQEYDNYTESLIKYIVSSGLGGLGENLKDILYDDKFDLRVESFIYNPPKDVNTNLGKEEYIELRTLGGSNGFEILGDVYKLKMFLYDAISQVFGGIKILSRKEVVKLMREQIRDTSHGEEEILLKLNLTEKKLKGIAIGVLKSLGDKVVKIIDKKESSFLVKGNIYRIDFRKHETEIRVEVYELGEKFLFTQPYKIKTDDKINVKKAIEDILDKIPKIHFYKVGKNND